jgi:hypothetical protein
MLCAVTEKSDKIRFELHAKFGLKRAEKEGNAIRFARFV